MMPLTVARTCDGPLPVPHAGISVARTPYATHCCATGTATGSLVAKALKFMLNRKLKYYMRLQYPATVVLADTGIVGELRDLPGCSVLADTVSEAYARLDEARRLWIRDRLLAGGEVPMPNSAQLATDASYWSDSALAAEPREHQAAV